MTPSATETYTIGVFKDVTWATRGLEALGRQGFDSGSFSLIARASPEAAALIQQVLGRGGEALEVPPIGQCIVGGPLVATLQGDGQDLARRGIAATIARAGFQPHDGRIFEALTERGGLLVAVSGEARAADALATLHSYGGGNAAIGAWHGRV